MQTKTIIRVLFPVLLLAGYTAFGQSRISDTIYKITDTVYFNRTWKICEQPLASYYRVGTLATAKSIYFYTGRVKDYSLSGKLLMDGYYSAAGLRQGPFIFYDSEGRPRVKGEYDNGNLFGTWRWFYPDSTDMAAIYFPDGEKDFRFLYYRDETGKVLMENGVGTFKWGTLPFDASKQVYEVSGSFNNGKRAGKWEFLMPEGERYSRVAFKEVYDKEGKFKRSEGYFSFGGNKEPYHFQFSPLRLRVMENIEFDHFFKYNGDSLSGAAVIDYLVDRKPSEIRLPKTNFDTSFAMMIRTLFRYQGMFEYHDKEMDGVIEFRIGEKGYPEDLKLHGNIDSSERKFLSFLLEKFRNIPMPALETVEIEKYHKIYMFTVDLREYFPAYLRDKVDKELFFSAVPKTEVIRRLDASKKQIKKYIRSHYIYF